MINRGKSPDKPWLIRLRREFLRRDPSHNKLGDGPLHVGSGDFYDDDEDEENNAAGTTQGASLNIKSNVTTGNASPNVGGDQSAADTPQPESMNGISSTKAEEVQPKTEQGDANMAVDAVNGSDDKEVKEEDDKDDKPAWLAEFPNSKGWEDLSIHDQVSSDSLAMWKLPTMAFTDCS